MMERDMSDFLFFVAMNEKYPNTAHAACVANDKQIVNNSFALMQERKSER